MIRFQGVQLIVHANEGASAFLLVTFNQLDSVDVALDKYFMQPQVEQENISCVGVMTRERGFFLSPEIEDVVALVDSMRAGRPVVVFGQSMGGYAALKFSRRLRADFVIAASPYFSVDADELELPDDRHRRVLMRSLAGHGVVPRPEFVGMAIRPEDVSGRLVVLFDPAEMIDAFGANLIRKHLPQTEFITVPHAGHVIYDASWSAELAAELFQAVQSPDQGMMARTVGSLRRNRSAFLLRTLSKAANRKPRLCVSAMRAPRITNHADYRTLIGDPFNLRAIYLLAERGEITTASAHLAAVVKECFGLQIRPTTWDGNEAVLDVLAQHRCLVLSCHGSFLTWNIETDTARFEYHPFRLTTRLPILATIRNGSARFTIISDGVEKPVLLASNVDAAVTTDQEEIVAVDPRLVAIRHGMNYLGALPDGGLQMLPAITHQQRLAAFPLQDSSALFERPKREWLDTVLGSNERVPTNDPSRIVQRATQRWRRLFKKG